MSPPTLHTRRLSLRPPRLEDFGPWAEFYASPRSVHEGGPKSRVEAWRIWSSGVALWPLKGYGPFGLEDRASGSYLGEVGIYEGAEFPEPELGWFLVPEAEGRGYAAEAARAVKDWAHRTFGWQRLISLIEPANRRSIALGLRLGGTIDHTIPGIDATDIVIRHDLGAPA